MSVLQQPGCPDAADVVPAVDIISSGQSIVLGTAVVLGLLGVVLYRWWSRRKQ